MCMCLIPEWNMFNQGIIGALGLGVGMCLTMVFGKFILGIFIGIVGILILLCFIPLCKGLK